MKVCKNAPKCGETAKETDVVPLRRAPGKCRGVFTHREPLPECVILDAKDAQQLVAGTGRWLRA